MKTQETISSLTDRSIEISVDGLKMELDARTGDMLKIMPGDLLWNRVPCSVTVEDGLQKRCFGQQDSAEVIVEFVDGRVDIIRKFYEADFVLHEQYITEEGLIRWNAWVELSEGQARSVAIKFNMSLPDEIWNWKAWSGNGFLPDDLYKYGSLVLDYGDVHGMLIPALSVYNETADIGLMLCKPFELQVPAFRYCCDTARNEMSAEFYWMRLDETTSPKVSLMFRRTCGCFREGLGWLFERYKEYFLPNCQRIYELEGGHVSGEYYHTEEEAAKMARLGMKWIEIHHHFPYYGQYHPLESEWWQVHHLERPEEDQSNFRCSPEIVRNAIKMFHEHSIASMPYIQIGNDGDSEEMSRKFPESIAKDIVGDMYPSWKRCVKMNADPEVPFGKDICRQIHGMLERYPDMDGMFVDQYGLDAVDFAHDDGMTMVENRPAYRLRNSFYMQGKYLSDILRKRGLVFIANGANNIETARYCDMIMAESIAWTYQQVQWFCIAKPMVFLCYEYDAEAIEKMFQKCLVYGAMYTSSWQARKEAYPIFDKYMPLLEKLIGRQWVFHPKAIQLRDIFNGNIFRQPCGDYIVTLVRSYPATEPDCLVAQEVVVNLPESEIIGKLVLTDAQGRCQNLDFQRVGERIAFEIPADFNAGVVELKLKS